MTHEWHMVFDNHWLSRWFWRRSWKWLVEDPQSVIKHKHYIDVIMASQITSVSIVCSTVCSDADQSKQRKHQSSTSLALGDRWMPLTKASNADLLFIWWRHHGIADTCIMLKCVIIVQHEQSISIYHNSIEISVCSAQFSSICQPQLLVTQQSCLTTNKHDVIDLVTPGMAFASIEKDTILFEVNKVAETGVNIVIIHVIYGES